MELAVSNRGSDPGASAAAVRETVDRLLQARVDLARRSVDDIVAQLDRVISAWLDDGSPWRARTEVLLAEQTGFSLPMLRRGLPLLLQPLRGPALLRLLDEELGDRHRLDRQGEPGGVCSPRLVAHVLPGNIPGLAAPATCLSLAVKSSALLKAGAGDRGFPPLFVESIAAVDAGLGACVAPLYWRGGDAQVESEAFRRADVIEAAGGDEAIAALRRLAKGRFIGHGDKISFAFVGGELAADASALRASAQSLAEDISIWDQLGCLSPQVVFVEGAAALGRVAEELGAALDAIASALPPRRLSIDEQAEVLRFRQCGEWSGAPRVLSGDALAWTIAVETEPALRPTCLHRTVRLQPITGVDALVAAIAPMRRHLECAGLAVGSGRVASIEAVLTEAGVHRVCAAGEMQRPDLSWKPSGRPRVAEWMDVETPA